VVIAGPTGAGKSDLSVFIASQVCPSVFEIVSADSVQVYKGLDIGSGKLSVSERKGVEHHLIDVVEPDYFFDTADFCKRAETAVKGIFFRGKIPLFTGGTGFYIDSFFQGLSPVPEIDPSVRQDLESECEEKGLSVLHDELRRVDAASAQRIHPHDRQRVLRALQVFRGTGQTLDSFRNKKVPRESAETLYIGIFPDKSELDARIEKRVDGMIRAGFIDEVDTLRLRGYTERYNSMKSIGYAEIGTYLAGQSSREEAIAKIKAETKEYARKQLAWFKRNKKMLVFTEGGQKASDAVARWLGKMQ
jgi:tRNA dimethylallyltransferase